MKMKFFRPALLVLSSAMLFSCGSPVNASSAASSASMVSSSSAISSESSQEISSSESSSSAVISSSITDYGTVHVAYCWMLPGYSKKLKVTFSNPAAAEALEYTVVNPAVCTITDGVVTALKAGSTLVEITSEHFEGEFTVYVAQDKHSSEVGSLMTRYGKAAYPEEGRTLFMGDSFFDTNQFWTNFYTSAFYSDYNAFSMGISATTASQWYCYAQKLIFPYSPKNVVIHIGTNDINDNHDSVQAAEDAITDLLDLIHEELPETKVYFFGVEASVAFSYNLSIEKGVNALSVEYAKKNSTWCTYLDSPSQFAKVDGSADSSLLRADGLHPLLTSYVIYKNLLKGVLALTPLPLVETTVKWAMYNGGSTESLSVGADNTSLTLTCASATTNCTPNRVFYSQYQGKAYGGDYAVSGHIAVSAAQNFGFAEIYAGGGLTSWSDGTCYQLVYQNRGSVSAPSYNAYWWGANNSITQTFESNVTTAPEFDFEIVSQGGMVYFHYGSQAWVKMATSDPNFFSISAEKCNVAVTSLSVTTVSKDVTAKIPSGI